MSPIAGSKSDYWENAVLNGTLGGPQLPLNATVHIALSTGVYSDAATGSALTEVSGAGYGRVAVTNNNTNWPSASAGQKSNGTVITFAAAQANWGTVQSFYIIDAGSAGNILYGADLTTARTIATGDTASFAVGSITITEN